MNVVGQQGEVKVFDVTELPKDMRTRPVEKDSRGNFIISHSEKGHHHIVPAGDAEIMECTDNVPAGMRILYAIVKNPTMLIQDAPAPHKGVPLGVGIKMFRIQREFNPFLEQARLVRD